MAGNLNYLNIGWKAGPAKSRALDIVFNAFTGSLITGSWEKAMTGSATLGSSLTQFYFFNKYSSNTQFVPGIVPMTHKPLDEEGRHIIGIQYMFVERMKENEY